MMVNTDAEDSEEEFEVRVRDAELVATPGGDARLRCSASGNVARVERIHWQREHARLPPGQFIFDCVFLHVDLEYVVCFFLLFVLEMVSFFLPAFTLYS